MGKVKFGLSDVHYAVLDEEKKSYSAVKAIPGAVNLSLDPEGDSNKFYADNGAFAVFDTNAGYTGDLEIAMIPDDVYQALLGFVTGSNGELIETTTTSNTHFGLSFRVETNYGKSIGFCFYNCTLSRPKLESGTTEDSTDPSTDTLSISFLPFTLESGVSVTKAHKELTATEAATWCSTIALPTITTTTESK